jgi:hypothetical protein
MKDIAASIRARLLNLARKEQVPFQRILTLYKQEGLLHRIVSTLHSEDIVLKGGLLFYQRKGFIARPTKDIDLLGAQNSDPETVLQDVIAEACTINVDDGLHFDSASIDVSPITGQTDHGGVRAYITVYLGTARTRLQIDMGFGDVITGGPVSRPYRTLLGNRSFSIRTYSDETIAAEKLDALISLGTVNSRYKDLYDLYEILIKSELPDDKVVAAACNTFRNRNTALPELPESLSEAYWSSDSFNTDWNRYLKRIEASEPTQDTLTAILLPRLQTIYISIRTRLK